MIARSHIAADFFDGADGLRQAFDHHFEQPYEPSFGWQYFYVPQLYSYLRARPEAVFPAPLIDRFNQRLRDWCGRNLAMTPAASPMLHVMVNGCSLSLHSDFHNGTFGYVYSLTRWEGRTFSGGETLLMNDGVANYKRHQAHGEALYQLIPPRFNQLLVFDDRIVHATQTVLGGMDPREGRVALVGHLRARGPRVEGALPEADARKTISGLLAGLKEPAGDVQGILTVELEVAADGAVVGSEVLADGLVTAMGYAPSETAGLRERLLAAAAGLRFPKAEGGSTVVFAILWPLPDLTPIRIDVRHGLSPSEARARLEPLLIEQPTSLEIGPEQIHLEFEAPMWVPSQRAQFESSLPAAIQRALE
jgi:hypothetical protein